MAGVGTDEVEGAGEAGGAAKPGETNAPANATWGGAGSPGTSAHNTPHTRRALAAEPAAIPTHARTRPRARPRRHRERWTTPKKIPVNPTVVQTNRTGWFDHIGTRVRTIAAQPNNSERIDVVTPSRRRDDANTPVVVLTVEGELGAELSSQ
jgi:hypothetical protein